MAEATSFEPQHILMKRKTRRKYSVDGLAESVIRTIYHLIEGFRTIEEAIQYVREAYSADRQLVTIITDLIFGRNR